jgi:hypothetical protein
MWCELCLPKSDESNSVTFAKLEPKNAVSFGLETLEICKSTSPEAQERIWLRPIDPARQSDILHEIERRAMKLPAACRPR